jgi:hexokinase
VNPEGLRALELGTEQLQEVRGALREKILRGLAKDGEEIKALPAYLSPPDPGLTGRALVVDTGGTNMRAAIVELGRDGPEIVAGPLKRKVPDGREGRKVSRDDFFGAHRELVSELGREVVRLPIGYCFSYPSEIMPDTDARLIRWTKGLQIPGVEGTLVGSALRDTLSAAGFEPGPIAVLNDTVASLLGGASFAGSRGASYSGVLGLIAGTGTNIATFFDRDQITKLGDAVWHGQMAVNLESGNFHPPHLTIWDEALDECSNNPGAQRFEKAVSGFYLPYLFEKVLPDLPAFDPAKGSAILAELRARGSPDEASAAARILDRSADLIAAALAGTIDVAPRDGELGVLAEGGLFWGIPGFRERVEGTLSRLLSGGARSAEIMKLEDANLFGSATAALMRAR